MKLGVFTVTFFCLITSLSGCITETIEEQKIDDEGVIVPEEYVWEDDGELTIVTYDVYGITPEMIDEFENRTDYEVTILKLDDAGSVLSHLLQHQGNQVADLAIGLDNTYLPIALDYDVLWQHSADVNNVSAGILNELQTPYAAPFDHGYICINYDKSIIDGENYTVPTSLWDLTSSEFSGKVAIPSPETSSPGRAFMLSTINYFENDEDNSTDWTDWWTAMASNDATITSGWSEAYETHYTGGYGEWTEGYIGDANFVVSYCHSPGVESYFNENWTKSAALDLENYAFHQIEFASAIKGGNLDAASSFIEYLLSYEINSQMPVSNYMYSVLDNTTLPETHGYLNNTLVPRSPVYMEYSEIAANMNDWLQSWNSAMVDA